MSSLNFSVCFEGKVAVDSRKVCLTMNKVSWVQSMVATIVSLAISTTYIIIFSESCFVVALFSALYEYYFQISCPDIIHVDKLCEGHNFTEI